MLFEVPGLNLGAPKTEIKKPDNKPKKEKGANNKIEVAKIKQKDNENTVVDVQNSRDASTRSNSFTSTKLKVKKSKVPALCKASVGHFEKDTGKTKLQQKMEEKLRGSRFRYLNQRLYQIHSREALNHFKENPEDFEKYHEGFRSQVVHWPVNPVDLFIEQLEKDIKQQKLKVVDMGCGEAKIMRHFLANQTCIKVHSFDLAASHPQVVVCDMSKVPLPDGSVDVVIFCLSLMNTNFIDAIREAKRILKSKTGVLRIAEVESRFEHGPNKFIAAIEEIGFKKRILNTQYKVFTMFEFTSVEAQSKHQSTKSKEESADIVLKPCLYKKR